MTDENKETPGAATPREAETMARIIANAELSRTTREQSQTASMHPKHWGRNGAQSSESGHQDGNRLSQMLRAVQRKARHAISRY